jgi:hypothetical protein
MAWGHRRAILILTAALAAGCFRPNITDGGFFCTDAQACPEDFRCNLIDRRCYRGNGGPEARVCGDAAPAVTPLCSDPPSGTQPCNAACQTGCGCGERCAATGSPPGVACRPIGPKMLGQACSLAMDDCGAGLVCVNECGTGGTVGRCLQFCRKDNDSDCGGGRRCVIAVDGTGTLMACQAPAAKCDPVAGSGCPTPALACYLDEVPDTKCECQGAKAGGTTCALDTECVAGYQCVSFAAQTLCRMICAMATDCTTGNCTRTVAGAPFGYCL